MIQLTQAQDAVRQELQRLDLAADRCMDQVNRTFAEVAGQLENRRQDMVESVRSACEEKRHVLEEQLALIEGEKSKVHFYSIYVKV